MAEETITVPELESAELSLASLFAHSLPGQILKKATLEAINVFMNSVNGFTKNAVIGNLYSKQSWTGLDDFVFGSTGAITANKIRIPNATTGYLKLKNATCLDKYVYSVTYKCYNSVKSTTNGLNIGFSSLNGTATISNFIYLVETGSNAGKIALYSSIDNITTFSTNALPAYTAGDLIKLTIENKTELNYTLTAQNVTAGTSITFNFGIGTSGVASQAFLHNTAYPSIVYTNLLGAYEIQDITYNSGYAKGGKFVTGDSIVQGFNCETPGGRFATLIGAQNGGGSGDKSGDVILRVNEIINFVNPKTCYTCFGVNDSDFAAWKTNLQAEVTALQMYNIRVVVLTPIPNNSKDMTPYRDWIVANYALYVDLFTPMKASSGTGLNSIYNTDGTHPNAAGHARMAELIKASPTWIDEAYYQTLGDNITLTDVAKQSEVNAAFANYYNKTQIDTAFSGYYGKATIDASFANVAVTFANLTAVQNLFTGDQKINTAAKGLVQIDRTLGTAKRIVITNGVVSTENA